jgi:hypothetical protein
VSGPPSAASASRAILTPTALFDANALYPAPRTLFYGPTAFGALPMFAPAFLATGNPTLALNLVTIGGPR